MQRMMDNLDFFNSHEREQERQAAFCPRCSECGEYVLTETALFLRGEWICEVCVEENTKAVPVD
mgnify:CR=1 FL=1